MDGQGNQGDTRDLGAQGTRGAQRDQWYPGDPSAPDGQREPDSGRSARPREVRGPHAPALPQRDPGRSPQGTARTPQADPRRPTYRNRPQRPALRNLPAPPRIRSSGVVLPERILLESRAELTRRVLARFPAAIPVLLPTWILLVLTLVLALAPTLWILSPLLWVSSVVEIRQFLSMAGLSPMGLVIAAFMPLLGLALSLAMVPLVSRALSGMDPRRFLTEADFQRAVSSRAAWLIIAPAVALLALLVLAIACQLPLPWHDLSYGVLSGLCFSAGLIWCAQLLLRRTFFAPRLLGIPDPRTLVLRTAMNPEARARTARRLQAQDRRHLPPTDHSPDPAMLGRSVLITARGALRWAAPALVICGWLVFLCADLVVVLPRLGDSSLSPVRSRLPWQSYLILGTVITLHLGVMALAPLAAMALSRSQRAQVTDLRTAPSWEERIRVNPWERRVVVLTTAIVGLAALGAVLLGAVLSALAGAAGAITWIWIALDLLILLPLGIIGVNLALRDGLRDIVYGPAGDYMRRRSPWSRIAPEIGTRAELAQDPAVRARRRAESVERRASDPGRPASDSSGGPTGARAAGATGTVALPAMPGADAGDLLHVELSEDGALPDFAADSESTWDEFDPMWSRGADTRRHPIPGDVGDMLGR